MVVRGLDADRLVQSPLVRTTIVCAFCLLAIPTQSVALGASQDEPAGTPAPDLVEREQELKRWVADYSRWKQDDERTTRRAPRRIRPKPTPPEWLIEDCRDYPIDGKGPWADACRLLVDWNDDAGTAEIRRQIAEARAQKEAPTKSRWWEHVHLDTLWPMTQWGSSVYGIVGTHATVEIAGRFQVFIAPGAMLLNLPGERGTREWKLATDWGVAYRLTNFRLPGVSRQTQLHVNLVTAVVFSGPSNLVSNRINLAGFSFTFKPDPAPP